MVHSQQALRAFVRSQTRLRPVDDVPNVRLHVADDVMSLARLAAQELGQPDEDLPYWAFPWAGGLAVARYLVDHPEEVVGKRVLDVATGSGLCAIVAARLGAASCRGIDIDPLSEAALSLNARANDVRISFSRGDASSMSPGDAEVILAGDIAYSETMAGGLFRRLEAAHRRGVRVLIGDPGRRHLPADLVRLGSYVVRTSRELEREEATTSAVYTFPREAA